MKKSIALLLALSLLLLAGCTGVPVIAPSQPQEPVPSESAPLPVDGSAVKTGLAVLPGVGSSVSAGEKNGAAQTDVTLVAVLVDDNGVITDCVIDAVQAKVEFDGQGQILTDLTAAVPTKNELGQDYGMKQFSSIGKEWNDQAAALADYAVGKTVEELKGIALNERGAAADGTDLAASCTVSLGGLLGAIETAADNAQHLGANRGDTLTLAVETTLDGSESAGDQAGLAKTDVSIATVTFRDSVITSCILDGVQTIVSFDGSGVLLTDLTAEVLSKNSLGEDYGMKKASGIGKEWNAQAAAFAAYVVGKTPQEVLGIALNEKGAPADADLAASCTIHPGGFQRLIEKAAP